MQRQMDEMFQRMEQRMHQRSTRLISPLGTYKLSNQSQFVDKGDHYELVTNIPESKENHIDISTQNGILSITAKIVHEQKQTNNGVVSTSRSVQMYQQSMSLPADADESNLSSQFVDGKLVISVAKRAGSGVKNITPSSAPATTQPATSKPTIPNKAPSALPKVDEKLKEKVPVGDKASVS